MIVITASKQFTQSTSPELACRWEAARGEQIEINFIDLWFGRAHPSTRGPGFYCCLTKVGSVRRCAALIWGVGGRNWFLSLWLLYWQFLILEELIRTQDPERHTEEWIAFQGQESELFWGILEVLRWQSDTTCEDTKAGWNLSPQLGGYNARAGGTHEQGACNLVTSTRCIVFKINEGKCIDLQNKTQRALLHALYKDTVISWRMPVFYF